MDIQKIKYNHELLKNKVRLEKELKMINIEISKAESTCDHVRVVLGTYETYENQNITNSICYCLKCGRELEIRESMPIIDATFYKQSSLFSDRLQHIRKILISIKEESPEISNGLLIEKIQEQIDLESDFSKYQYNKTMILVRNINNKEL